MFNRSLVLSLFFVALLGVANLDAYIATVIVVVVLHQIVFHFINQQRTNTGVDDGKIGKLIKSNVVFFGIFIMFYMLLPSSVIFLRNFHIKEARISYWVTWLNGIGMVFGGILFFILRVTLDNKLNVLYSVGGVYILLFNTIPFTLVLYGRLKEISDSQGISLCN